MKRGLLNALIFLTFSGTSLLGQGQADNWFDQGNQLYKNEQYQAAIMRWEAVLESGVHSASIYYNMANAYYHLSDLASSIYYYEKALMLNPEDTDVLNNRAYVQNALIDVIQPQPKTLFQKWDEASGQWLSLNQWAWIGILSMTFFVFWVMRFSWVYSSSAKRLSFVGSILSIALFMGALFFGAKTQAYAEDYRWAVVFQQEMSVRSGPRMSDEVLYDLHAGTKLRLLQQQDQWHEIELTDGRRGWVLSQAIKSL
jgi:tetratricopeptide (TPR) repeat protein